MEKKTLRKFIEEIRLNKANLNHIAEFETINGTLLIGIENAMQAYAKQETERLQAENKAMREKLQEVHKYLGSHDCTEATELRFMQEISTLLNQ